MVSTMDTSNEHNSRSGRKRKGHTDAHDYDLEELAQFFHLPINDVAVELGVCATVLKKICRKSGISRWPHRKIKSIDTMIEALESVTPSNPSEAEQIAADIQTLREKRQFLMKNPNASYKSVVPKYAINAYNARLQKSGGIAKSTKRKKPRTIAAAMRAQPYPTRYRGTKSVPTYYFEEVDAEVPSMGRNSLITSQDEFAATQLLHLRDMIPSSTKAHVTPAPVKVTHLDISQEVPTQEDQSSFENFVSSLPKMRFKRCWEQQHTAPPKLASDVPSFYFPNGLTMPKPEVMRPQLQQMPQMVPNWGQALHKSPFSA